MCHCAALQSLELTRTYIIQTGVPVYRSLPEKKDRKLTWISTTGFLRVSSSLPSSIYTFYQSQVSDFVLRLMILAPREFYPVNTGISIQTGGGGGEGR